MVVNLMILVALMVLVVVAELVLLVLTEQYHQVVQVV